jgi:hypothetical protein
VVQVKFVVGLCGAGKSHLIAQYRDGFRLFDEGVAPGWPAHGRFLEAVRFGHDSIAVDIAFRLATYRTLIEAEVRLIRHDVNVEWLFFANDALTANNNCIKDTKKQRDVQGNIACNNAWTLDYDIPTGVVPIPIHAL